MKLLWYLVAILLLSTDIASRAYVLPKIPNLKSHKVAVITDSRSCEGFARYVLRRNGLSESRLRPATVILTVVRSGLNNPLNSSYDSIGELKDDIKNQMNMSGDNGHIYVYEINDDLEVSEIYHSSFEWTDEIEAL